MFKRIWIVVLLIVMLLAGCAGTKRYKIGEEWLVESSGGKPGWLTEIPATKDGIMYFRGVKTQASNLDGGLTDAREHAARQVAEMVESEVHIDYERARVEYGIPKDDEDIGSVINDLMIAFTDAMVQGVKEKESYWDRKGQQGASGISYLYDVYTLVSLSEDDYKRIANNVFEKALEKAKAEKNKKAEKLLEGFREEVMERRFEE